MDILRWRHLCTNPLPPPCHFWSPFSDSPSPLGGGDVIYERPKVEYIKKKIRQINNSTKLEVVFSVNVLGGVHKWRHLHLGGEGGN